MQGLGISIKYKTSLRNTWPQFSVISNTLKFLSKCNCYRSFLSPWQRATVCRNPQQTWDSFWRACSIPRDYLEIKGFNWGNRDKFETGTLGNLFFSQACSKTSLRLISVDRQILPSPDSLVESNNHFNTSLVFVGDSPSTIFGWKIKPRRESKQDPENTPLLLVGCDSSIKATYLGDFLYDPIVKKTPHFYIPLFEPFL